MQPPPPATEVFQITTNRIDPNTFSLDWTIKKGFFLYKSRMNLQEKPDSNVHIGTIRFPEPITYLDSQGKSYPIYRNHVSLPVAVLGEQPGEALLNIHYQGCSDDGFCYPPQVSQVKISINKALALDNVTLEKTSLAKDPISSSSEETNSLTSLFSSGNWGIIVLSFFGFGLLLSFTPCVLPMVPVLSGIIIGHGKDLTTRKAFFLSLSYVLSMSVTYAFIGAFIALMGKNLQIIMQSPYVITLFSLMFVALALSMFNFYELRLPVSWQAKLANVTRSQSGGHYFGAALMGCLSILILSPCVTAPLIGALSYIAQSGNIALGTMSLFFLGLGMGTPLLLIGTSAGRLLPKTGQWMNSVKAFFGVLLLAVAIYLMERILPSTLTMSLWASLCIFSGIYLDAFQKATSHQEKFCQGLGIILVGYGLLILVGASLGHKDPLQPLRETQQSSLDGSQESFPVIKTLSEAQQALTKAKGTPVMLDFYADWCESCKLMAKTTLKDQKIIEILKHFIVLKIDLSENNTDSQALLTHFNVVAPPTFLFIDAKERELTKLRLVGDVSVNALYHHLQTTLHSWKL